jgi:antitoxin YefM
MTAITATDARKNFFGVIKQVNEDRTPVEVVSKHGNVVVMSKEDFDSMSETAYLLRNPANAHRLLQAVEDVRAGRVEQHDLLDAQ